MAAVPVETTATAGADPESKASVKASQTEKELASKASEKATEKESATTRASEKPTDKETSKKQGKTHVVPHPGQCGLEDDGTKWFKQKPFNRIKTTIATPEQQAKYQSIIDTCFAQDTIHGKRVNFHPDDVMTITNDVHPYFESEPVFIEDVYRCTVIVGDLHGQLYDLDRIFKNFAEGDKPGYLCSRYLFMGDYVDRGHQSLEIIMALFCLKMLYPDKFILLRGNHEFPTINVKYGFADELRERYINATAKILFRQCNLAFSWMSICAIVGERYFCAHGGISPRQMTRAQLRGLYKPIYRSQDNTLVHDMLWADPIYGLKGRLFNYTRTTSVYFALDTLVHALHNLGCVAMFRGHTAVEDGFYNDWDLLFTVFSATSKKGDGGFAYIDDKGHIQPYILKTDPARNAWQEELWGAEDDDEAATQG